MIKFIALFFFLISSIAIAGDKEPEEMYMANDAGGFVILTITECKFPQAVKQGYRYRVYATEDKKDTVHEGCWDSPSTAEAPRAPGVTIVPLVNTWWIEGGAQYTYEQQQFGPEKKIYSQEDNEGSTVVVAPSGAI